MKIISCDTRHLPAIQAIFNDAIIHSTALYEYQPRTLETVTAWFATKIKGGFPLIGIENENGELMGFATYGVFRNWPGYKYTVEHSVYVDARYRGKGIGSHLMKELIRRAQAQNVHTIIGAIDTANEASMALHRSLGFEYCGTIKQAGFKFGRWLDMVFYQLILPTPTHPTEG
ncbi:MAG: N-acetyltransferase family protein [bacterium]